MEIVKVELPRELEQAEVHILADWHIGDKHCDMDAVRSQVERVRDTPNAYAICNGDLINNATKTSVSDGYAEQMTPMQEIETLVEILKPIAHKILVMCQGNHEARTWRTDGIDLTGVVARELGIADRYSRTGALLYVKVGELSAHSHRHQVCYAVHVVHGSGGGRKEGGKAIRLADMATIVDADVYIHSHTHLPMIMREGYLRADFRNFAVEKVDRLFVNGSAALDYGGYGEQCEFKPASKTPPVIYLSGRVKRADARL